MVLHAVVQVNLRTVLSIHLSAHLSTMSFRCRGQQQRAILTVWTILIYGVRYFRCCRAPKTVIVTIRFCTSFMWRFIKRAGLSTEIMMGKTMVGVSSLVHHGCSPLFVRQLGGLAEIVQVEAFQSKKLQSFWAVASTTSTLVVGARNSGDK